jgi:hypothetical protein
MVVLERAEFDPRHGNGQSVFDLNVALMVITNILMILRLYVRGIMVKNLGWDDLLAVVAWVNTPCNIPSKSGSTHI